VKTCTCAVIQPKDAGGHVLGGRCEYCKPPVNPTLESAPGLPKPAAATALAQLSGGTADNAQMPSARGLGADTNTNVMPMEYYCVRTHRARRVFASHSAISLGIRVELRDPSGALGRIACLVLCALLVACAAAAPAKTRPELPQTRAARSKAPAPHSPAGTERSVAPQKARGVVEESPSSDALPHPPDPKLASTNLRALRQLVAEALDDPAPSASGAEAQLSQWHDRQSTRLDQVLERSTELQLEERELAGQAALGELYAFIGSSQARYWSGARGTAAQLFSWCAQRAREIGREAWSSYCAERSADPGLADSTAHRYTSPECHWVYPELKSIPEDDLPWPEQALLARPDPQAKLPLAAQDRVALWRAAYRHFAETQKTGVVPLERVEQHYARIDARAQGDESCARPANLQQEFEPSRYWDLEGSFVTLRWYLGAYDDKLQIGEDVARASGAHARRLVAAVHGDRRKLESWLSALDKLRLEEDFGVKNLGQHEASRARGELVSAVTEIDGCSDAAASHMVRALVKPALERCRTRSDYLAGSNELALWWNDKTKQLEVNAREEDCLARALRSARMPSHTCKSLKAEVVVPDLPATRDLAFAVAPQPATQIVGDDPRIREQVRQCYQRALADRATHEPSVYRGRLEFDSSGRVLNVDLQPQLALESAREPALLQCLTNALRHALFPCSVVPEKPVQMTLCVGGHERAF
jgi:hypothetical protein